MNASTTFVLACLLLVSCSKQSKPEDKSQQVRQIKNTESTISKDAEDELHKELHEEVSKEARENKFIEIVKAKAETGQRMNAKVLKARAYLAAYHFDLWNGSGKKGEREKRESLFSEPAAEFMEKIQRLTKKFDVNKISPMMDIKVQNDEFAYYALSIAAFESVDFKRVIESVFKAERENGVIEGHSEALIRGENKEAIFELMKARVNILAALALKTLVVDSSVSIDQHVIGLVSTTSFNKLKKLDVPEILKNNSQALSLLQAANTTKYYLDSLGIKMGLEKNLKKAFRKVSSSEKPEIHAEIAKLML